MAKLELNEDQIKKVESFLQNRFHELSSMREDFDDSIEEEIDIYNDVDKYIEEKADWEERITVPYIYTIVQTMVGRLDQAFFSDDNFVRVYSESDEFYNFEEELQNWLQDKLDCMRFKSRARDFIEDSLVQRTTWLQLKPVFTSGGKFRRVDFDILKWFDVWFDTTAVSVNDTDIFARKIVPFHDLSDKVYFNLDMVKETGFPEDTDSSRLQEEYQAKHGVSKLYDINPSGKVELLEWYGMYEVEEGKYEEVIFTMANRKVLIRAEKNVMETKQKRLFFPIRCLRQANSLIGKSVPQLVKKQQYELNEIRSLRMQNVKTQIKLLFKYKKDAGIDFDELFAKGGNAVGFEDNPDDVSTFDVPNMVQIASFIASDLIQDMQQITGAVDYLMGTSAARGMTETASGIQTITEQALFKFGMMAKNIADDIINFITFVIVLYKKYDKSNILLKHPDFAPILEMSEEDIEDTLMFDINIRDLTQRRDIERSQFINATNVIAGLMAQTGGDLKELLRQILRTFKVRNIDKIMGEGAAQQGPGMLAGPGNPGGGSRIAPNDQQAARPEEIAEEINPTL